MRFKQEKLWKMKKLFKYKTIINKYLKEIQGKVKLNLNSCKNYIKNQAKINYINKNNKANKVQNKILIVNKIYKK